MNRRGFIKGLVGAALGTQLPAEAKLYIPPQKRFNPVSIYGTGLEDYWDPSTWQWLDTMGVSYSLKELDRGGQALQVVRCSLPPNTHVYDLISMHNRLQRDRGNPSTPLGWGYDPDLQPKRVTL